jgi:hypothetical protein
MRYRTSSYSLVAAVLAALAACIASCDKNSAVPAAATVRNDHVEWYLHCAGSLRSLSFRTQPTFVTFSTSDSVLPRDQLIAALENPKAFAAAHMLLLNAAAPTTQPGSFDADSAHRDLALRLAAMDRITLQDQPDGSCLAIIDGLRVVLRTTEKKGKYFGQGRVDHTIYAATAEIDESQQPAIRDQWKRRPSP